MRILVLLIALTGIAHAEDRAKAERFFRSGEAAFRKQRYAVAADNFEQAYAEAPLPEIAFSAAQAYRRQWFIEPQPKPEIARRAIELYRIYLEKVPSEGRRGDASDGIAEMKRELDKLAPSVVPERLPVKPPTRVVVSVVADEKSIDAKARLDGKPVELFTPLETTPGEHTAEVEAAGYFPQKKSKQLFDGTNDVIELALQPKPAKLVVRGNGRVLVDGIAGAAARDVPAGKHVVTVTARGHEPATREITLARGEERKLDIDLERTAQRRAVPWVLIGGGGAAALCLTSTLVALYYDGRMSDIDDQRLSKGIDEDRYTDYKRITRRRDLFRTSAYVLGGAAIVTAGIAAGMYLFDRPSTEGMRIVPDATPTSAGAAVVGHF